MYRRMHDGERRRRASQGPNSPRRALRQFRESLEPPKRPRLPKRPSDQQANLPHRGDRARRQAAFRAIFAPCGKTTPTARELPLEVPSHSRKCPPNGKRPYNRRVFPFSPKSPSVRGPCGPLANRPELAQAAGSSAMSYIFRVFSPELARQATTSAAWAAALRTRAHPSPSRSVLDAARRPIVLSPFPPQTFPLP